MSAAKRLRRESSMEEDPIVKDKVDEMQQRANAVAKLASDRLSLLEQAVPLAAHFAETHDTLLDWFQDIEGQMVEQHGSAIKADQIKAMQDEVKVMLAIAFKKNPS